MKTYIYTARSEKDHVHYNVVEAEKKAEAIRKATEYCKANGLKYDKGSLMIEK